MKIIKTGCALIGMAACLVLDSLSAKDHLNYKVGYGDIKICEDTNVTNCF
jgi:hypothetical protein